MGLQIPAAVRCPTSCTANPPLDVLGAHGIKEPKETFLQVLRLEVLEGDCGRDDPVRGNCRHCSAQYGDLGNLPQKDFLCWDSLALPGCSICGVLGLYPLPMSIDDCGGKLELLRNLGLGHSGRL